MKTRDIKYISKYIRTLCVEVSDQLLYTTRFTKRRLTLGRQVVNPLQQAPQKQSVAKPGISLEKITLTPKNCKVKCLIKYYKSKVQKRNTPGRFNSTNCVSSLSLSFNNANNYLPYCVVLRFSGFTRCIHPCQSGLDHHGWDSRLF